ncbi:MULTISPECIES: type I 3-dehydroquinate dehydratase [Brochothrix]|uniref:3-dehydroquinate dehydratase n=1 Tax=Brochothrix thermosphacta TaxID=2756 RepID=A0A1D2KP01_BROTH|nr:MULTISPECIES: type I 3-dehydroquinate dehydratase [Brochothrix]ATF26237.1 type I 3-dehydroquinate dehydratase [Brochothrix thermosphacta]ATH85578.1 type I 3-dehydroquinate dehydratase [Brochothrix thermosphacta]MBR5525408.1 type I 3-dehydroquinate dehydratase [Brochothrix sp.]MPQ29718.1 type I 3-dehydroquinate dehydratase [Brochothrix thermosphacta]ODJ51357.1 type I 3-dehydroquinate dehydratase [Brochothrix thermosphacta]
MVKTVRIGHLTIGEGAPKRCVSFIGNNKAAIKTEIMLFKQKKQAIDMIEWRVDCLDKWQERTECEAIAQLIKAEIGETPVIFTCRTMREGGLAQVTAESYSELLNWAINSSFFDAIDIEQAWEEEMSGSLIQSAKSNGLVSLVSHHNFEETPSLEAMVTLLSKAEQLGGDIPKLAVMPQTKMDVLRLLEATLLLSGRSKGQPVITMSMGELGQVSRVIGSFSGSALTFGSLQQASAPGQIEVETLAQMMN